MTLRDDQCFHQLAAALQEFGKRGSLLEIGTTGNWGDALIHAGQREFLRDHKINVEQHSIAKLRKLGAIELLRLSHFLRRRAIISGGGAWCDWYSRPLEMQQVSRFFSRTLVMPSSYTSVPPLNPRKVEFWRRDNLESMPNVAQSFFCHDLAFYLQPRRRVPTKRVGLLFREDVERAEHPLPPGNRDISLEGTHLSSAEGFLDQVGDYEIICTNRLHVSIAGAVLDREVHMFRSRSAKIASVFEGSLKDNFAKVHFHSDAPVAEILAQI